MQNLTCPDNQSFNIIYSKLVTCCFSKILEEKVKDTFTPVLPIASACACVALAVFLAGMDMLPKNSVNLEAQALNGRVSNVSRTRCTSAVVNLGLAILFFGCALTCAVTSFRYAATLPGWVNRDLNRCFCETPQ